jgi:ribosomal protein L14E/L6E/L27E
MAKMNAGFRNLLYMIQSSASKPELYVAHTLRKIRKTSVGKIKKTALKYLIKTASRQLRKSGNIAKALGHRQQISGADLIEIRSSITPGTVLVLIGGDTRGRRAVFLKWLDSGLLLVSGHSGLNGVPLRRVRQSHVIATSIRLDLGDIDLDKFDDNYFRLCNLSKKLQATSDVDHSGQSLITPDERMEDQATIDAAILEAAGGPASLCACLDVWIPLRITAKG